MRLVVLLAIVGDVHHAIAREALERLLQAGSVDAALQRADLEHRSTRSPGNEPSWTRRERLLGFKYPSRKSPGGKRFTGEILQHRPV